MLKNWNIGEVKEGEVFHFKNSLEPFIWFTGFIDGYEGDCFLNINTFELYGLSDLNIDGYSFYSKDNDEDYLGVEVDGKIKWVAED